MKPNPTDPDLLTDADVTRIYQLRPGTLRSLRHRKQIPYVRLGGRIVRYRRDELDAWIESRAIKVRP